jgi:hypothetical protein
MEELYVEVSDGVKRSVPPKMIKFSELQEWQEQHESSTQGLFRSICCYDAIDPNIGDVISPFYADFDDEQNPENARQETIKITKKLMSDYNIPCTFFDVCFSGLKGFAIEIPQVVFNVAPSINLPLIYKSIMQELVHALDLKTADLKVYDRRRLWRLQNSRHQKSHLFKIHLTFTELQNLTMKQIRELATKPRIPPAPLFACNVSKAERLFKKHKEKIEKWLNERKPNFRSNELKASEEDPPCIKTLLASGVKRGARNNSMFTLAVYYAQKGLSSDEIENICDSFAQQCEGTADFPRSGEVRSIVNSAIKGVQGGRYSVGCSSDALVDLCDKGNCPFFQKQKTQEAKNSCGANLEDSVFEQIENQKYIVYSKETLEVAKQKTVEGFEPIKQLLWKPVNDTEDYESEQALWDEVRKYLYEHIDIAEGYDALVAWLLASWTPEKWRAVPYLFFYGPPGSGKTWALEVLASIGFRPFMSASATLASIFRVIDQWHPTMFLDETEVYMKKDRDEILNLLNAGYRRDFPAVRVEETNKGLVPRVFDVFGFKALAGTREFMRTLKSRCIILTMSKAVRRIDTKINEERAMALRRKLLLYRFRKLATKDREEESDELTGRLKELFDPLIAVAPSSARTNIIAQARKIEKERTEEEQASAEAVVFKAILAIYRQTQEQKITIEQIAKVANEKRSLEENLSSVAVGRVCSKLGFKRTLSNSKRAIFWNKDVAERLVRRYGQPDEKQEADGLTLLTGVQRTIEKQGG